MGSLSQVIDLPIGSAIGEVPQAEVASSNLLLNTHAPAAPVWTAVNTCTAGLFTTSAQWDAGFLPNLVHASAGAADYFMQAITGTVGGFAQVQVTASPGIGLNNNSNACRLEIRGVPSGFSCYVDFNPKTGQIIGVSSTVPGVSARPTTINVQTFQANVPDALTYGVPLSIVQLSFFAGGLGGDTGCQYRFYPSIAANAGEVAAGGFQIDSQTQIATSFISTPANSVFSRQLGTTPRTSTDRSKPTQTTATSYTVERGVDADTVIEVTATGQTVTLPLILTNAPTESGQVVTINNNNTGTVTIACPATNGLKMYGPNLPAAGTNSFTFPYTGSGATLPNASITLVFAAARGAQSARWLVVSDTLGTGGGGVSASPITNSLAADVVLNNTGTYFDGPSVAQGSTGTWFVSGTVTVLDTAGLAQFAIKLWDGATVIASGYGTTLAASNALTFSLSGYIAAPAGNLRISVRDQTATTGLIKFNLSGNSKDSTITAFRIA